MVRIEVFDPAAVEFGVLELTAVEEGTGLAVFDPETVQGVVEEVAAVEELLGF